MSVATRVNRAMAGDGGTARAPVLSPGYKLEGVGVIPEDWGCSRLGDLATRVGSGITPTGGARTYVTAGRPFLRSQNVGWGLLHLHDLAFITDETHSLFAASEIEEGDVLLNITGASIGRSAVADSSVARGNVNQHVCEIRPDPDQLDSHFLNNYVLSTAGQKQIDNFQTGGNRQGLNYSQIRSFLIPRPSLTEQRAIAEALSDVSKLLEASDALISKKKRIKQAAMQQLLTGRTRLPGFHGEWERKQLREIGHFLKGSGVKRDDAQSGTLACVRYGEIYTTHHDFVRAFHSWISSDVAATATRLECGDILFAGSGETKEEIGKCVALVSETEAYAGGDIVILRPRNVDPMFLGYALNMPAAARQKANLGQGDAVVHISAAVLAEIHVAVPSIEEQTAIVTVLADMDAEIAVLEARRDKTRDLKQGMMQELLTGGRRLVQPGVAHA